MYERGAEGPRMYSESRKYMQADLDQAKVLISGSCNADHLSNCMVMRAPSCLLLLCYSTHCIAWVIITAKVLDRQQQLVGLLEPCLAAILELCNLQQHMTFPTLFMPADLTHSDQQLCGTDAVRLQEDRVTVLSGGC